MFWVGVVGGFIDEIGEGVGAVLFHSRSHAVWGKFCREVQDVIGWVAFGRAANGCDFVEQEMVSL